MLFLSLNYFEMVLQYTFDLGGSVAISTPCSYFNFHIQSYLVGYCSWLFLVQTRISCCFWQCYAAERKSTTSSKWIQGQNLDLFLLSISAFNLDKSLEDLTTFFSEWTTDKSTGHWSRTYYCQYCPILNYYSLIVEISCSSEF